MEHRVRDKAEEGDGEMFLQSPGSQNEALSKNNLRGHSCSGDEINMFVTVCKTSDPVI